MYNKKETMVLSSSGSISFSQIASEWRLNSDGSIPLSLSRLSNFKRPTYVDNLGKFRGASNRDFIEGVAPNFTHNTAIYQSYTPGKSGSGTIRAMLGINGSNSGKTPTQGYVYEVGAGGRGMVMYITATDSSYSSMGNPWNGTSIFVQCGNGQPGGSAELRYDIPTTWTDDVLREIVWSCSADPKRYSPISTGVNDNTSLNISRLWIDGVLVDADFLDYNTLGTNLKVWGDDAGGPHGQWSSSVYHRYTVTDLYDYKLPLLSKGYAEIWKDDWISEYGVKG